MKPTDHIAHGRNSDWVLLLLGWLFAAQVLEGRGRPGALEVHGGPDRLELESASPRELRRLPGIGATRAAAIAQMRWKRGGELFPLQEVSGIGERIEAGVQAWLERSAQGTPGF